MQKEAMLWHPLGDGRIQCDLCWRHCKLAPGQTGLCRVRKNIGGKLYTLVYGDVVSWAVDPIEKKPLFHFLPGTLAYSIATVGCNFFCKHCQNWEISQASPGDLPTVKMMPEDIVRLAKETGSSSIAYTYVEPTIFFELAYDTGNLAAKEGLANVFVTNGYMSPDGWKTFKSLHAANIDIKGDERFYREVSGGVEMEHVLESVKLAHRLGKWVEVTNLIIPGYNDDPDTIRQIVEFVKGVDKDMPLHFTAFFPAYKMMDVPPTPREILVKARELALEEGLHHVYIGNVSPGDPYENTYCPNCGELLVERFGYQIVSNKIENGRCPVCGTKIAGVWNKDELFGGKNAKD